MVRHTVPCARAIPPPTHHPPTHHPPTHHPPTPAQVLEDERKAEEAKGGTETSLVLTNDGTGVQDIGLLTELLEVIDSSLPLIGKVVHRDLKPATPKP